MSFPSDPSDVPAPESLPEPTFRPLWSADLRIPRTELPWLWDGYLLPSNITLLTSQWKSGKSTLLSVLLARRAAGGTLAGRALKPGRTAVVCEEDERHWGERRRTLDFGPGVAFYCLPYLGRKPTFDQWRELIYSLAIEGARSDIDLVVFDPLAPFLPGRGENNADLMLQALLALDPLLSGRMAVLLLHHPRKGPTRDGQAARGSGALPGFVDVLVEMRPYRAADDDDRRRVLVGYSRYPATPRRLVIEWAADGTDYAGRGDVADEDFREQWGQMLEVFREAPHKLTRRQVFKEMPRERGGPSEATLRRWLGRAVAEGLLCRDGKGHEGAPFRYWVPAREEEWREDPWYRLRELEEADRAALEELGADVGGS